MKVKMEIVRMKDFESLTAAADSQMITILNEHLRSGAVGLFTKNSIHLGAAATGMRN